MGIGVGDVLIRAIGVGPVQLAFVVVLAMSVAVVLNGGPMLIGQAGSSAVLVATLLPPGGSGRLDRCMDAFIGGSIGLAIAALLPVNPLTAARRQLGGLLGGLAGVLREMATAIDDRSADLAEDALVHARAMQPDLEQYEDTIVAATEVVRIAPLRWRSRQDLARYAAMRRPVDFALRGLRVLGSRAVTALRAGEPRRGCLRCCGCWLPRPARRAGCGRRRYERRAHADDSSYP
jgi:uncharacterized membrane protein YgaE (UPF0421/DUF939 family)